MALQKIDGYDCYLMDYPKPKQTKEKGEIKMSDSIIKEETMTGCSIAVIAPTATKENTNIFKDEENNVISIEVLEKTEKESVLKNYDFSLKEEIKVSSKYAVSTTSCSIKDGIILLKIKTNENIKRVEID